MQNMSSTNLFTSNEVRTYLGDLGALPLGISTVSGIGNA